MRQKCEAKRAESGSVKGVQEQADEGEVGAKVAAKPIIIERFI